MTCRHTAFVVEDSWILSAGTHRHETEMWQCLACHALGMVTVTIPGDVACRCLPCDCCGAPAAGLLILASWAGGGMLCRRCLERVPVGSILLWHEGAV